MMSDARPDGIYDVCVVGGGPAGAALATFLQRAGHRCSVLERSTFPRYHIGESLIPHTFGALERLGLLPKLRGSHFPEKRSVRFVSPDGAASEPFYFHCFLCPDVWSGPQKRDSGNRTAERGRRRWMDRT